ncbi:hypothetical protein CPB84DRAFT_1779981 [Gymnopilus junonius]|uniref:Uncharacterized protein n=1 Tax=Gymnopilus junonius TaxID=109634 RepID=A0A9P5TMM9_GYMJU|nr:hypothetical protein CPB84DRAFT_1779981 [Gymnopilus junonius]
MLLLGSSSTGGRIRFFLTVVIWIQLSLLQPIFALAVPKAAENFIPVPPPKHALISEHNAASKNGTKHVDNLLCTPFGACEPCPPDAMHEPFCRPFGNRRLMHCVNKTSSASTSTPSTLSCPPGSTHSIPEISAWESCGRIPSKERGDFLEFVVCNILFAIIALGVLFFRERRLRLGRAKMLAARIGIGGGGAGGGGRR